MKYLKPLRLKKSYYSDIEKTINAYFYEFCFAPITAALAEEVRNDTNLIAAALRKGRIRFEDGKFVGKFNSVLSKEFKKLGAKFEKGGWKFDTIPAALQYAVGDSQLKAEEIRQRILFNLDNVHLKIEKNILKTQYEKTVKEINADIAKRISIPVELTESSQKRIADEYSKNLELYIKKWSKQNILKLRQEVATNTYNGNRAEGLVKNIEQDYAVSRRKAKFLARQETSLLMSKIQEERYSDAGIRQYKWSGVEDQRERPDHKLLEGKVFTWDNPPVVDRATGRKANPGEDYNCRCIAIPIVS